MKKQVFTLILLSLIAVGLRIYKLDTHSYRGEELIRITEAQTPVTESLAVNIRNPFFRLILHFWLKLFHTSEFATRSLSIIFGILSIIPLYLLARRLIDKKVALIVAYLATISPFYILLSRTVEDFTLSILLASISLYLFIRWMEENIGLVWYVITTILMLYSGPFLFLILLGEWIYFGFRWQAIKDKLKSWLVGQLFILLGTTYWIVHFVQIFPAEVLAFDRLPALYVGSKLLYPFYAFSLGETVLPWNWKIVLPAAYIFAATLTFGLTRIKIKYRTLYFVLVFLLLPLAPAIGIGKIKVPISLTILGAITFFDTYSIINLYKDKEYHNQSFTDNWQSLAEYVHKESITDTAQVVAYHRSFKWYYKGTNLMELSEHTEEQLTKTEDSTYRGSRVFKGGSRQIPMESSGFLSEGVSPLPLKEKVIFVYTCGSGIFSSDDTRIHKFKEWLDHDFNCIQAVSFFENNDYKIKRRLLKREFPQFRVQVLTYERRRVLE
ncbi:MAG: glycosyltransferase family 39 protein [Candidatus Stahlbacteria bacterium]|nr:glycosyltransferase family 39 protein [Candidatus Stahlbacteria bacterium]